MTMIDLTAYRREAAQARQARGAAVRAQAAPDDVQLRAGLRFPSEVRAKKVTVEGTEWYELSGYASVYEHAYDMWDFWGPYTEVVSTSAAAESLAADPMVVYRFNHGNMAMATTRNRRLTLSEDGTGFRNVALVNPKRQDVKDLVTAVEDRDVTEQSFMFMITSGRWSPDYTEFRIEKFDVDRGDVGPVTYGANPATDVAARSGELLRRAELLPPTQARALLDVLTARGDLSTLPAPGEGAGKGRSLTALDLLMDDTLR